MNKLITVVITIVLSLLVMTLPAFAVQKNACKFSLTCDNNGNTFPLDFPSPSNECSEDDAPRRLNEKNCTVSRCSISSKSINLFANTFAYRGLSF